MQNRYFTVEWASLRRSIIIVKMLWHIFDVTKGKSKDYYNLLIREKAKPLNIIQELQSNFHFNSDHLKQIFKLPHYRFRIVC